MTKANSGTATVTLPADTEIVITRAFDAPRQLLCRAWTTPDLVRRWWSGHRGQVTSIQIDLRVGGAWCYVMRGNDGSEDGFHGEYREIVPGERGDQHRAHHDGVEQDAEGHRDAIPARNVTGRAPRTAKVPARTAPAEVITPPVAARAASAARPVPLRLFPGPGHQEDVLVDAERDQEREHEQRE